MVTDEFHIWKILQNEIFIECEIDRRSPPHDLFILFCQPKADGAIL